MKVSEFLRMIPDAWRKDQQVKITVAFDSHHVAKMQGDANWIINNIPADYDMPVQRFHNYVDYNNGNPVSVLSIGAW